MARVNPSQVEEWRSQVKAQCVFDSGCDTDEDVAPYAKWLVLCINVLAVVADAPEVATMVQRNVTDTACILA